MYNQGNEGHSYSDRNDLSDSVFTGAGLCPVGDLVEVGMVLDLDEGSLATYRNGELGWVQRNLTGDFCWVAANGFSPCPCACIRISRGGWLPHERSS